MTQSLPTDRGLRFSRLVGWFLIGVVVAGFALWSQQRDVEDLAFVLRVGAESGTREFIESELGTVPLTEGLGHDGQYSYLIARDPLGLDGLPELADDGAYRYRRALYGWVAGGFGSFPPEAALVGLVTITIISFGVSSAATADIAALLGARVWAVVGVLGSLGLWLSVQLATADALAMALALLAVSLALRSRVVWTALTLAAAALTKDAYVLFAVGLAGWMFFRGMRRSAWLITAAATVPLALWSAWLSWQVGDGLSSKGNFSWPLVGLAKSFSEWETTGDLVQGLMALLALIIALVMVIATRHALLTWLTIPWVLVASVSSAVVWGDGNNAVRVFAPLWLLAWLGAAWWVATHSARPVTTPG